MSAADVVPRGVPLVSRFEGGAVPNVVPDYDLRAPVEGRDRHPVSLDTGVPTGARATCEHCGTNRPLKELLLVTDVASGAQRFVCRPNVALQLCFRNAVRVSALDAIAPADPEAWELERASGWVKKSQRDSGNPRPARETRSNPGANGVNR